MTDQITLWHVTSKQTAQIIIRDGFLGGWGDAGFGVYTFDDFSLAQSYAAGGGWDGELKEPTVIEITTSSMDLSQVIPDPGWPNPEDYENVRWFEIDPDKDTLWTPERAIITR